MSGASQGASEAGGVVIGVTCGQIESNRGIKPNPWVEVRVPFESLQDRLQYLVRNNDGIVVLPGGIGTLSEFALAWSYMQVGEMTVRPLVTLGEMWRATVTTFSRKEYGTADYLHLVYGASSAEDAVRYIRAYEAPDSPGAPGPKAS
jgi:predicted Rossmann-fold nucleotide-binding protein